MTAHAIEVNGLSKHFGKVVAVKNISFIVEYGTTCALLGANGAGKTTTIAMLLGLVLPTHGNARVLGHDIATNRYKVLGQMNFSSPYVDLPQRLKVKEILLVYGRLYGVRAVKQRLSELVEALQLEAFLNRKYGTLSAGQKTRVSLAKALLNFPKLILLDEPTASLDPDSADRIRGYLIDYQKSAGATILLTSHNMTEVERICDKVLIMRAGSLIDQGTPEDLVNRFGRGSMEEVFLDIARGERTMSQATQ